MLKMPTRTATYARDQIRDTPAELTTDVLNLINSSLRGHVHAWAPLTAVKMTFMITTHALDADQHHAQRLHLLPADAGNPVNPRGIWDRKRRAVLHSLHLQTCTSTGRRVPLLHERMPLDENTPLFPAADYILAGDQNAWALRPSTTTGSTIHHPTSTLMRGSGTYNLADLLGHHAAETIARSDTLTAALLSGGTHASNAVCDSLGLRTHSQSLRNSRSRHGYARYSALDLHTRAMLHVGLMGGNTDSGDSVMTLCTELDRAISRWRVCGDGGKDIRHRHGDCGGGGKDMRHRHGNSHYWRRRRTRHIRKEILRSLCEILATILQTYMVAFSNTNGVAASTVHRTALLTTRWRAAHALISLSAMDSRLQRFGACLVDPFLDRPLIQGTDGTPAPLIYVILGADCNLYYIG